MTQSPIACPGKRTIPRIESVAPQSELSSGLRVKYHIPAANHGYLDLFLPVLTYEKLSEDSVYEGSYSGDTYPGNVLAVVRFSGLLAPSSPTRHCVESKGCRHLPRSKRGLVDGMGGSCARSRHVLRLLSHLSSLCAFPAYASHRVCRRRSISQ